MGKTNRKGKLNRNKSKTKKIRKHSKLCKCKPCKYRKSSKKSLKSKILRQKNQLPKHFRKAKHHGGMNPGSMNPGIMKPSFAYSNLSASMRGGKIPVGLVGYPYDGGNVDTWPGALASSGVSAANHMSNYYPLSPNGSGAGGVEYPIQSNDLIGGKKRKRSKALKKKGKGKTKKNKKYNQKGGFFPDIVDLARQQITNATNTYNGFVGESPYPSPYPYEQPINENVKLVSFKPTDL